MEFEQNLNKLNLNKFMNMFMNKLNLNKVKVVHEQFKFNLFNVQVQRKITKSNEN